MKITRQSAFTLVEVLVTVSTIAILVSIALVFNMKIQLDSRDKERETEVTIIAEALETYYNKNGEYPSVATVTNTSGPTVMAALSIRDQGILVAPRATSGTTNSLTNTAAPTIAQYGYQTSVNGGTCTTGGTVIGCTKFRLSYRKEADNSIVNVDSRR